MLGRAAERLGDSNPSPHGCEDDLLTRMTAVWLRYTTAATLQTCANRNARNEYEEKLGPHKPYIGLSVHTQNTYLYQIITSYNKLPKEITMIRDPKIFKKWLKKYYLDKNIILKTRENPNPISYMEDEMNVDLIRQCEN